MNKELKEKCYRNSIILEKVVKLNKQERQKIILDLLKGKTERELGEELGIPHSTIHDWKTLRQSNIGAQGHVSFSSIYRKLKEMQPEEVTDWGRLVQIKEQCERLLRCKSR